MLPQMTMYSPVFPRATPPGRGLQGTPMGAYKGGNNRRDLEISGAVRMIPVFHPCRLIVIHDEWE
jgi:hypothetical protein